MAIYTFTDTQMKSVADAIRAKTGGTSDLTIEQMPTEIASIVSGERTEREVWIHGHRENMSNLLVDTGIPGDMDHTLEVTGYGNIYDSSTLFGSVTAGSSRQVVDLLTSSMKVRFAWGNSGLMAYEYPVTTFSPWHPATFRFNKTGFTINGFASNRDPVTISMAWTDPKEDGTSYTGPTGGASTANYKVFPGILNGSNPGVPGVFRSAKIFDSTDTLIHHFVPILYNDWTLVLRDKITNIEIPLTYGPDGFEAYWAPRTDNLVNLT